MNQPKISKIFYDREAYYYYKVLFDDDSYVQSTGVFDYIQTGYKGFYTSPTAIEIEFKNLPEWIQDMLVEDYGIKTDEQTRY